MDQSEKIKEIIKLINEYLNEEGRGELEVEKILLKYPNNATKEFKRASICWIDPITGKITCPQ